MSTTTLISPKAVSVVRLEWLPQIGFTKKEVLNDAAERRKRDICLKRAERLGNGYRGKAKIVFESAKGGKHAVIATVWAATKEFVSLKKGIFIPKKAILSVEF